MTHKPSTFIDPFAYDPSLEDDGPSDAELAEFAKERERESPFDNLRPGRTLVRDDVYDEIYEVSEEDEDLRRRAGPNSKHRSVISSALHMREWLYEAVDLLTREPKHYESHARTVAKIERLYAVYRQQHDAPVEGARVQILHVIENDRVAPTGSIIDLDLDLAKRLEEYSEGIRRIDLIKIETQMRRARDLWRDIAALRHQRAPRGESRRDPLWNEIAAIVGEMLKPHVRAVPGPSLRVQWQDYVKLSADLKASTWKPSAPRPASDW